jgi:hypothetical protein
VNHDPIQDHLEEQNPPHGALLVDEAGVEDMD